MIRTQNLRDYEVSIWTLQDSFITVLKQSNLENKEKIQDVKMNLKDDGENTFSFKIPMYVRENSDISNNIYFQSENSWRENPIWYTTRNGNIIASLRKVKVIFNKGTNNEEVFEFIINNVKESHEGYEKYCEVSCDGLAFYELGKQGYEIVLSADNFKAEVDKWYENENNQINAKPINNINYWIEKVLENSNWKYIICMDWSIYDGVIDDNQAYLNMTPTERNNYNTNNRSGLRRKDKVYKEPYVASWKVQNNKLVPETEVSEFSELEKLECVEGKESNRYNLLQSIAEAFQVFCKFKYIYDDNYHIIDRYVIFYNNFINESDGIIDFNYKYNTSEISREMDGTDLISKMYVQTLNDSGTEKGIISLSDAQCNPSLENFLLNFDYLYQIGTISQEQYDEVAILQKDLHNINVQLVAKNNALIHCINQIPEWLAKQATAKDLAKEAEQRVGNAESMLRGITSGDSVCEFTTTAPHPFTVIHGSDKDYINITSDFGGLIKASFSLYPSINSAGAVSGNKIKGKEFKKNNGVITQVYFPKNKVSGNQVYAVFKYNPVTPYNTIKKIWAGVQKQANADATLAENMLGKEESGTGLQGQKKILENEITNLNNERLIRIAEFERIMGPALREGTWQPEDEYANNKEDGVFELNRISLTTGEISNGEATFYWDNELFDGEQDIKYNFGANEVRYYPCIQLDLNQWNTLHNLENLNFIFPDIYLTKYTEYNTVEEISHYFAEGSDNGCQFAFIRQKSNNTPNTNPIIPVLMIVGVDQLIDAEIDANTYTPAQQVQQSGARLKTITVSDDGITENNISGINSITWVDYSRINNNEYEIVYPRFKINADRYLINEPEYKIYKDGVPLEENDAYYQLYRDGNYHITLKNVVLNSNYAFHYATTTAAEAIYLDAVKIMKENSVPKTSYSITPLAIEQSIIKTAYNSIGQLAHINDQELKFENVMGYISEVELDLDKPWEDSYTIKNYKTKFEDLFSTIVASSEAMKKNSQLLSMLSNAFDPNGQISTEIIKDYKTVYIPTPEEIYSQYEPKIRTMLKESFDDAGEVLAAAQKSVNDVAALNVGNASILSTFVENIKENMTPTTFENTTRTIKGTNNTSTIFKVGDIWERSSDVYLATENSSQVEYSNNENRLTSLKGWSLIKDGSLAQIKGAKIDANAESGAIAIEAGSSIDIRSGGSIAIAANSDLSVTANNTVNISGSQINLTSTTKGIKIMSSATNATSYIDVKADSINMITAGGISMAGAGGINIYTSDGSLSGTSAISISKGKGIYLGSGQPIVLYSNTVPANASNSNYSSTGASALISKDRILFGVTNGINGSAVDLTKDYIVFGSSFINNEGTPSTNNIGTATGTAGVKITRNSIEMATGTYSTNSNENTRNYIAMNDAGIKIANSKNEGSGAIVTINQSGVLIGTVNKKTDLINDIQGSSHNISYNGARFQVYAPNFVVDNTGTLYAYNAYISGTIYSGAGQIGGWTIGSTHIGTTNMRHTSFIGMSYSQNAQNTYLADNTQTYYVFWAGNTNTNETQTSITKPTNAPWFGVRNNGLLEASNANISGTITATSLTLIGEAKIPYDKINNRPDLTIYISKDGTIGSTPANGSTGFVVSSAGLLTASNAVIWGKITSSEGAIGGWTIETNRLKSGSGNNYVEINAGASSATNGSTYAIWAGSTTATSAPFRVTKEGSITATSGSIGGWTIGSNYFGNASTRATSTIGISIPGTNDIDDFNVFWSGGTPGNGVFKVTKAGKLSATGAVINGTLTAGAGSWLGTPSSSDNVQYNCGWYIGSNYIGSARYRGESKVGMSTGVTSDKNIAFWAGGVPSNLNTTTNSYLNTTDTVFYITNEGVVKTREVTMRSKDENSYFKFSTNNTGTEQNPVYLANIAIRLYHTGYSINSRVYMDDDEIRLGFENTSKSWLNYIKIGRSLGITTYEGVASNAGSLVQTQASNLLLKNINTVSMYETQLIEVNNIACNGSKMYMNLSDFLRINSSVITINGTTTNINGTTTNITSTTIDSSATQYYIKCTDGNDYKFRVLIQSSEPTSTQKTTAKNKGCLAVIWIDIPSPNALSSTCSVEYIKVAD